MIQKRERAIEKLNQNYEIKSDIPSKTKVQIKYSHDLSIPMQKIMLSAEGSKSKLKKPQNNRTDNFFETNFVNTNGPKNRKLS